MSSAVPTFSDAHNVSEVTSNNTHNISEVSSGLDHLSASNSSKDRNEFSNQKLSEKQSASSEKSVLDDQVWLHHPQNPHNWPFLTKWSQTAIVSAYTFVSPLASSMLAPGLPDIARKYHITNATLVALPLSIFLLAFCIGPLIVSPLSEMYGRRWVLHLSNIFFLFFNLMCAFAPNTAGLILFRFFAGLGGATPVAIGGGIISDLFGLHDRAAAMAVFSMGPLLGPVVGPVAGGFIAESIGFKWVFIIISCFAAVTAVIGVLVLKETYHPLIRARLVGDPELATSALQKEQESMTKSQYLWLNLSRPIVLLFTSFICFILSLFMAIQYGFLYLLFTTFPQLFPSVYGFSTGITGLAYLGLGIGFFASTIFAATISNKVYFWFIAKNNGVAKPEYRIPTMLIGSFLVPVGLLWYGWSAQAKLHWIMPIIGSGIFGAGMMLTYLPIQLYLVDAFKYTASALAAASTLRSLFGFFFPLFASQMFEALGNGGGYSLLAGIAIVIGWPFPIWIYYYGEKVRARSDLNR